jgi:hypothetical protein
MRRAVAARTSALVLEHEPPDEPWMSEDLTRFIYTMVHAPALADLQQLVAGGRSEDEVFELTLAAAIGLGRARLNRALEVLDEAMAAPPVAQEVAA